MRLSSINFVKLCLFPILAGCTLDLSNLGTPLGEDAATSPDTIRRNAGSGGNTHAEGGFSADTHTPGGRGGAGGGGGRQTGSSPGAGGSLGEDGRPAAGGSFGAPADADDVAEDAATAYDSGGADDVADSLEDGGDGADDAAAALEVSADDARDLGIDGSETGGKDQADAGCFGDGCPPLVVPISPTAMKCNLDGSTAELAWSDLSAWRPTHDSRLCGNADAYYVQGSIVPFEPELQVLAEVYAPEDATWHPISGGPIVRPTPAGDFDGYFCLPDKRLERTFRFRIAKQNTSQDVGVPCLIHVR